MTYIRAQWDLTSDLYPGPVGLEPVTWIRGRWDLNQRMIELHTNNHARPDPPSAQNQESYIVYLMARW